MNRSLLSRFSLISAAFMLPVVALAQAPTIVNFSPTTGTAGTSVTITGTNLATATAVLLNGQSLRITSKLTASVTVTVPVAASTGKLVVTNPSGSVVAASQFGVLRSSSGTTFRQLTAKGSSFNNIRVTPYALTNYGTVYYSTPTATDLTGTGRVDLLVGNGNGNIEYYTQSAVGSTTYTKVGNLKVGTTDIDVANFAKPTVVDLDGNGLLDLLVGTGDGARIARFEQAAGSTAFTAKGNLQSGTGDLVTNGNFPRPTIADLDGNGRLDLIIGDYTGVLKRYEATAVNSTTFGPASNVLDNNNAAIKVDGTSTTGTSKPLLFDLDGDGLLDLILGSQSGALTRYQQTSRYALTFKLVGNLLDANNAAINMGTSGNAEGGYAAPLVTDIDNNGNLDILIGDQNGTIYRYEQVQTTPLTGSPLPVTLTSFTGSATTAGNQLRWATAQEVNSAKFVVERSADGLSYQDVASVAAAGNSTSGRSYQYLDATSLRTAYYRLRQVDADGKTAYSSVVVVTRAATTAAPALVAFPNPFEGELLVALPAGASTQVATVSLTTLAGQTMYSRTLEVSGVAQALPGLPGLKPGVYVLRLTTATGSSTLRVVRR